MSNSLELESRIAAETPESGLPTEPFVSAAAESSRLSRHILNTFHSARKAFPDDRVADRLSARLRRLMESSGPAALHQIALDALDTFHFGPDLNYAPEITVRYDGSGPVRLVLETSTLRQPEGAHALVADLWYAAPDWARTYPEAVRHATVQLPPDAGIAAFEFFPEKSSNAYVLVAGLRWHLDFRHRDNFSRQPGAFNAIARVLRIG